MKILVITQYFWPEEFRINDICKGLVEDGNEVHVLTGLPNYPSGKIYEGYSFLNKGPKEIDGIKIMRVSMIPRGKNNSVMLALNYISFMLLASIRVLFLLFRKYDRVFIFQVSPITTAIPAIIISKIKRIPSYIYIQDLWPETLYSIVSIKGKKLRNFLKKICNKIYNAFDNLLLASKGYEDVLVKEGISKEKLIYFPQWAEDIYSNNFNSKREENGDFILTFAGNIGKAQSVDTIIKAANLLKDYKNIKWHILGSGSEFENIKKLVKENSLEDIITLFGRKPVNEMPKYFLNSQGLIVTLKNDYILRLTLPAKIQSYMASGKPILASISGEGSRLIKESKSGLTSEAEDYEGLAKNVMKLYNMSSKERNDLGKNGRKYFEKNFTRAKLLNYLKVIIS